MKKLVFALIFLISTLSFSWEKIQQEDDFGDFTGIYMLAQPINEGYGYILVGKETNGRKICMLALPSENFVTEDITIKMKSKNGITNLMAATKGVYVRFSDDSARQVLLALRDSNVVKFNLKGVPFSVSGTGFTKMYKNAYWQDFNSNNPVKMPPKGQKAYSLYEGADEIEAQDDIWN